MGETFFPAQDDRLKKLKSTDEKYGILLRRGYERGTLTDRQREEFTIGVQEGLFEPAEGMDEKIAGFGVRARAGAARDPKTGLTGFDRDRFERDLGADRKTFGGRARTVSGEIANSATFGNADRIAAAAAKTSLPANYGSKTDITRRMANAMREGGFEGDAELASQRLARAGDREANPVSAFSGELTGYVVPGAVGMKLTSGGVRMAARATGIERALIRNAPSGVTRLGRSGRYAKEVLPRAIAGGAVDGAVYGQTVSRSNEEAVTGEDISLFSDRANSLMLRDATYGAIFGGVLSPVMRGGRVGVTYASDVLKGVPKAERAGGRTGMDALEHRLTPKSRKKEVIFDNMRRMGMGAEDAQYVMRAVEEGRMEDADKVVRNSYNAALIMIEKRLRKEGIPIERLENKMNEIAYNGDSVDEFFFEIASLAGSGKTQSLANALATVGGEAKMTAQRNFDDRADDAFERVKGTMNKAFGIDGSDYYKHKEALEARGRKAVNEAYRQAEETGHLSDEGWGALVHESGGMSIMRQPAVREALGAAADLADDASDYAAGKALRKIQTASDELYAARQALDDALERNTDQGEIAAAGDALIKAQAKIFSLKPSVGAFKYIDQELTDMRFKANGPMSTRNPRGIADSQETLRKVTDPDTGLTEPRNVNAKFENAKEALEEGRKMFAQGTDVETLLSSFERQIARYDGSDPEILPALLQGFVRGAEDAMSTSGNIGTALRRLYGSPRARQKLEEMLSTARELAAKKGATKAEIAAIKAKMTKNMRVLLGGKKSTKVISETGGGTSRKTIEVPGRIQREISMQDSKNQTTRGSQTASRFQAIREQDEFADTVDEVIDAASKGVSGILQRYGRAAVRRVTQSGIYTPEVNRELGDIMFTGGKDHIQKTVANLKRVRSARMGKGDLDLLPRPDRVKVIHGGATGSGVQSMSAGARTRRALANQRGEVNLEVAGVMAGGAVGFKGAQDIDGDGRVDIWERALFTVGGMIFGRAVSMRAGNPATFHMFMGMRAKTANQEMRAEAQRLAREGVDMEEIRQKTGWFRGAGDKEWRFEVSDSRSITREEGLERIQEIRERMGALSKLADDIRESFDQMVSDGRMTEAQVDDELERFFQAQGFGPMVREQRDILERIGGLQSGSAPLDMILHHPTLFDAYPRIAATRVEFVDKPLHEFFGQTAFPNDGGPPFIQLNKNIPTKQKRLILLHEVMHLIQKEEGFAGGGHSRDLRFMMGDEAIGAMHIASLRDEARLTMQEGEDLQTAVIRVMDEREARGAERLPLWLLRSSGDDVGFPDKRINLLLDMYRPRLNPDGRGYEVDSSFQIYKRLVGETEARNVSDRAHLDDRRIAGSNPNSTADIPPEGQIDIRQYGYLWNAEDGVPTNVRAEPGDGTPPLSEEARLSDGTGMAGGREGLQPTPASLLPLAGAPKAVTLPGAGKVAVTPHAPARAARDRYMARSGRKYTPIKTYKKVDEERATRIADAFSQMTHEPTSPRVRASYDKMINETIDQYAEIEATGLKVEFIEEGMPDPYAASPRLAIEDVKNNNHLWVYPTDSGYGQGAITAEEIAQNPLLRETDIMIGGRRARANDIFRIVHDYFGHITEGNGFRADGEENAWRLHASMYSPEAVPAMTTETRGQNSWLNFGPHGEANRNAKSVDTVYAEQKIGLLPDWAYTEGLADDIPAGDKWGSSGGSAENGQKTAVEFARGKPNEEQLLAIRKRQLQYDNRETKKARPDHQMSAQSRIELQEINARLKELKSGEPPIAASGFGPVGGFKSIDGTITNWGRMVAEKTRARLAPVDDPRHYGPMLKKYGMPDADKVVYNRPLYEQVDDPRAAARDIAESSSMRGGQESGERAIEYVAATRSKRVKARELADDRTAVIKDQGEAGQAVADAMRDVEEFFGANGAHRQYKTQKAKRAAYIQLVDRVRIAQEAATTAMGTPTPRVPDMPPEREQMLVQEMNRAERPEGYRSVDMMAGMDIYDSNGMREAPDVASQYDQSMPVKPNVKPRPRGRRRAAIDNRATEMMLDGSMASEGVRAVNEAGDGFRVSNRVGRAVGYGAIGLGAAAYAGQAKMAQNEIQSWKDAEDERMAAAMESGNPPEEQAGVKNNWRSLPHSQRIRMQHTLNSVNDTQIADDGDWGPQTEQAIREFQQNASLEVTGVLDDATLKALNMVAAKNAWQWEQQAKKRRSTPSASTQLQ